jgi:tRNA(fMet)-specific endonuclease VapC
VALIDALVTQFPSFGFDAKAAKFCGEIRVDLERKGLLIGSYDIQIAATALANNCVLVTHNTREFSRVEGLQIEDWES